VEGRQIFLGWLQKSSYSLISISLSLHTFINYTFHHVVYMFINSLHSQQSTVHFIWIFWLIQDVKYNLWKYGRKAKFRSNYRRFFVFYPNIFKLLVLEEVVLSTPVDKMLLDYLLPLQKNSFVFLLSFQYWEKEWRTMQDIIDRNNWVSSKRVRFLCYQKHTQAHTLLSLISNWKFCNKILAYIHLCWNNNSQFCRNILGIKNNGNLI